MEDRPSRRMRTLVTQLAPSILNLKFGGLQIDSIIAESPDWGGLVIVRSFAPLGLDEVEHAELTSLASRRTDRTSVKSQT